MRSFREIVFPPASDAFGRQGLVPEVVFAEELFVAEWFAFLRRTLGSFHGLSDFFDCFYCYIELSGLVPASHVRVETLKGMFFLECSELLGERQFFASLSEIARDLVQLNFAHG